ncbi:MAG: LL-diaminopimelate aminotransferase [Eggerthellaceae bacterium]|nr:LL-diaminopimelate aminotransferase [Eggerthellaceae bacterium]
MAHVNPHFQQLPGSYLFSEIARRTAAFKEANPDAPLIRMGIGDVTQPLAPAVVAAMHAAVDDLAAPESFHGYGPEQGYGFLRDAIAEHDFAARNINVSADEIFISDGAKSDCGNIGDIFSLDAKVAVCDPVYPVYVDSNAMAGRAGDWDAAAECWTNIYYMPTVPENNFVPALPDEPVDLVYLCSPNNPTGTVLSRADLEKWVRWANEHDAVILFDAAYERFVTEEDVPRSIYEIEGARTCAIEFRSFSKTAGFTGARCGYTVVPKDLVRDGQSLRDMWNRRQCTKFNGASYVIQRGAAAVYTPEGERQVEATLDVYRGNARVICEGLKRAGFSVWGGVNSPYIWCATPEGMGSWEFFDLLLNELAIVTTPGAGFGPAGEGFIRLTAFNTPEATQEAITRIQTRFA